MRRSLSVLFATIVGLVLLLSFHTSPESAVVTAPVSRASSTGPSITASGGSSTTPAGPAPPPTSGATTPTSGTYTGSVIANRYGPVQVRITVTGSKLTDVTALELPSDRAHSQRLSAEAAPVLRTEALRAQSARVDVVSGATFTSESYAQSLQSALDQAQLGG